MYFDLPFLAFLIQISFTDKKKKSLILFKFDNACELKRVLLRGNSRLEGKALRLDWWNPNVGCLRVKDCVKEVWMGVLGLPLHFWGEQFFKRLGGDEGETTFIVG